MIPINFDSHPVMKKSKTFRKKGDNTVSFETHLSTICNKVNQELNTFHRISKFVTQQKLRMIMKAFMNSQYGYIY